MSMRRTPSASEPRLGPLAFETAAVAVLAEVFFTEDAARFRGARFFFGGEAMEPS